jgi:hypothetical protein
MGVIPIPAATAAKRHAGATCVLASHHPAHRDDGRSMR